MGRDLQSHPAGFLRHEEGKERAEWRRRALPPRPRNTFPMLATSVPAESVLGVRFGPSTGHVPGAIPS
jgi:hypothetical protein